MSTSHESLFLSRRRDLKLYVLLSLAPKFTPVREYVLLESVTCPLMVLLALLVVVLFPVTCRRIDHSMRRPRSLTILSMDLSNQPSFTLSISFLLHIIHQLEGARSRISTVSSSSGFITRSTDFRLELTNTWTSMSSSKESESSIFSSVIIIWPRSM